MGAGKDQKVVVSGSLEQLWIACCMCWELNFSCLQEQQALLTAEPSFQPQSSIFTQDLVIVYSVSSFIKTINYLEVAS